MASRKKKRRFLSLKFITGTLATLGLVGGGGYGLSQSSWVSNLGGKPSDPSHAELKETHGDKLIAEMTPNENGETPKETPVVDSNPEQEKNEGAFSLASHTDKPKKITPDLQTLPQPSKIETKVGENSKPPVISFSPAPEKKETSKSAIESVLKGETAPPKPTAIANPFAQKPDTSVESKPEPPRTQQQPAKPPVQTFAVNPPSVTPKKLDELPKSNALAATQPSPFQKQPAEKKTPTAPLVVKNDFPPVKKPTNDFASKPVPINPIVSNISPKISGTTPVAKSPIGSNQRQPVITTPKKPQVQKPVSQPPKAVVTIPANKDTNNAFQSLGSEFQKAAKAVPPKPQTFKQPATQSPTIVKQSANPVGNQNRNTFEQKRVQGNALTQNNLPPSSQTQPHNFNRQPSDIGAQRRPAATLQVPSKLASTEIPRNDGTTLRKFEGVQSPTLSLEKTAPGEIQVGRPATFRLLVKNNGRVPAYGVTVVDEIPRGTQLKSTKPNPTSQNASELTWNLGTLQPGDVSEIVMELLPQTRGEIGSVARVGFQSQASVRTICTKPQLDIQHSTVNKALIGDDVIVDINIRNSGDGAATGVSIEEIIPENLVHAESNGRKLQYPVGTLAPGESRNISLRLKANKVGVARNVITAKGDGQLTARDELNLEVVAPDLQITAKGPTRRFLERQATYDLAVMNRGTAPATNVRLAAKLPRGMKFVQTDKNGQYDPRSHAVYWSLVKLPTGSEGRVKLTLLPVDVGQQKIDYIAQADLNLKEAREVMVAVEQYSELFFDVDDVADPIEVGTDTVYNVRVVNQGSKPATNVRVGIKLPAALKAISAQGPTQHQIAPSAIQFGVIDRLAPNAEAKFTVQVKGQQEGDHRIQVTLSSDERKEVVAKEESTKVYSDYR